VFASILDGIFNGVSIGSILLLAALGLAIVFGLMGVINMAHGELMMLGAYTTFVVQNAFRAIGGPLFEVYIFFALIAAFVVAALVGLLLERGVIRYLYGRPLETLLATWGVSLILQQFVRSVNWVLVFGLVLFCILYFGGQWIAKRRPDFDRIKGWVMTLLLALSGAIALTASNVLARTYGLAVTQPWFGAQNKDVTAPAWLRGGIPLGNYQLPYTRLFIMILTVLCVLGVYWFLNRTAWGLRIRAVTQNRNMSACLGIPTRTVDALTFALGSGLAGIARMRPQPAGFRWPQHRTKLHCEHLHGGGGGRCRQTGGHDCRRDGNWNYGLHHWHGNAGKLNQYSVSQRLFHLFCDDQHGKGDGVCAYRRVSSVSSGGDVPAKRAHGGCLSQICRTDAEIFCRYLSSSHGC
jgi:Branched-chain amino acid ABC-type transport system, permease components